MSIFLNPDIEAMSAYVPGEQPRDKAYIKLNTNENPYPPAPTVIAAMNAAEIEDLRLYSDPTAKVLKGKLAATGSVHAQSRDLDLISHVISACRVT